MSSELSEMQSRVLSALKELHEAVRAEDALLAGAREEHRIAVARARFGEAPASAIPVVPPKAIVTLEDLNRFLAGVVSEHASGLSPKIERGGVVMRQVQNGFEWTEPAGAEKEFSPVTDAPRLNDIELRLARLAEPDDRHL